MKSRSCAMKYYVSWPAANVNGNKINEKKNRITTTRKIHASVYINDVCLHIQTQQAAVLWAVERL